MALVTREIPLVLSPLIGPTAFHGISVRAQKRRRRWQQTGRNAAAANRGKSNLRQSVVLLLSMGLCCSLCGPRGPHVWMEPDANARESLLQASRVKPVVRTRLADEMRDTIILQGQGRPGEYELVDPVACSLSTARALVAMAEGTAGAFGLRLTGIRWTADDDTMEQTQGFFELARADMQFGAIDRVLVRELPFDDSHADADLGLGPAP